MNDETRKHIERCPQCDVARGSKPRKWSQFDEDDITLDLVERLKPPRYFVEIGAGGHGTVGENNTHCLLDAGWDGLWVDANPTDLVQFWRHGLRIVRKHVTLDNIGEVMAHLPTEFGVFSLDVDGNDWWLWRQVLVMGFRPWICIVEFNAQKPMDEAFVAPYRPAYTWDQQDREIGASAVSMCALGREHGYALLRYASETPQKDSPNMFFVRNDLAARAL